MQKTHDLRLVEENSEKSEDKTVGDSQFKGRAIVTYGRSLISLVIARSLHERGIEVIGADDVGLTVLSFSKHVSDNFIHTSFQKDEEQALNDFEEAIRKHAPEDDRPYVLIPAFRDARIFAKYRDRFEPLIKVSAPDIDSINMVDPKDVFADFAQKYLLPIPETQIIYPGKRKSANLSQVRFPRIIKPVDGVGGRGVKLVKSIRELNEYLNNAEAEAPLLLQEAVDGEDYCLSIIADHGKLVGAVAYRNLRQFPNESGAGAIRETVDETPFLKSTEKLVKLANWNGVAEIDYRWNGQLDTEPKIIEINPRYWAGLFHSTESGVDFPWIAYRLAAGIEIEETEIDDVKVGLQTKTPAAWILSIAEEIASSDEHVKKSGRAWIEMKAHARKGDVIKAASKLLKSAGHGLSTPKLLADIQSELSKHDDLPSEFSSDDDPAVSLGILFALSSLKRHGTLPPELKFEDSKADETDEVDTPTPSKLRKNRRPIIGITKPEKGDTLAYLAMKLAVWLAGGKPVKITSSAPREPHSVDGLLFGGGSDVYPERYQGETLPGITYDQARDDMEASWAKAAIRHDIPVMGVCRGMQMLNVAQGGTLSADLSSYNDIRYPMTFLRRLIFRKTISLEPDSWLSELSNRKLVSVNSIHSQAILKLGNGFKVSANEINGLIQSIEHESADFMVGVQFHPEFLIHKKFARNIFSKLVDRAKARSDRLAAERTAEQG